MNRSHVLSMLLATLVLALAVPLPAAMRREMIVSTQSLAEPVGAVILVEVGDLADFQQGHIPGARLLDRKTIMIEKEGIPHELPPVEDLVATMTALGIGDETRVVFYSRQPLLATRGWFTLDYLGHGHRSSVLDGGYAQWIAEGRPISTEALAFAPAQFTADVRASAVTTFEKMREIVRYRSRVPVLLIDARPAAQYRGSTPGAGIRRDRAGHIPSAINVPWQRNLLAEDERFLSPLELQSLYAQVDRDKTLITYCRSGMEASMTYFVLRYLGFDPSLYDGSYVDWSNEETPVI